MNKRVVPLRIEHEQALVEKYIDRDLSGTVDHELGTRLAEDGSRAVDQLAGMSLDA